MSAIWSSWTPGYTCWVRYVLTLVISQHPRLCKWWLLDWGLSIWVLGLKSTSQRLSHCEASVERVIYSYLSLLYKTMWLFLFYYVINTAMILLRFVCLCLWLFLGHIWAFYASYFVLEIWVWQDLSTRELE